LKSNKYKKVDLNIPFAHLEEDAESESGIEINIEQRLAKSRQIKNMFLSLELAYKKVAKKKFCK
jgi:hypothetical protein